MEFFKDVFIFVFWCWLISITIKKGKEWLDGGSRLLGGGDAEKGKQRATSAVLSWLFGRRK